LCSATRSKRATCLQRRLSRLCSLVSRPQPCHARARCRPAAQCAPNGAAGAQDLRCFAAQLFEDWRVLLEGQEASAGAALATRQVHADSRAPSWACTQFTSSLVTLKKMTLLVTKRKSCFAATHQTNDQALCPERHARLPFPQRTQGHLVCTNRLQRCLISVPAQSSISRVPDLTATKRSRACRAWW